MLGSTEKLSTVTVPKAQGRFTQSPHMLIGVSVALISAILPSATIFFLDDACMAHWSRLFQPCIRSGSHTFDVVAINAIVDGEIGPIMRQKDGASDASLSTPQPVTFRLTMASNLYVVRGQQFHGVDGLVGAWICKSFAAFAPKPPRLAPPKNPASKLCLV